MKEISNSVEFIEDRPDHHFRTEIPNFVFDILNPNQLAVYCHIKRICGDMGRCWMSMKNLAKTMQLGETTVRQCLQQLSCVDFFIEGSLIEIIKRKKPDGSQDSNIIRIVDVWRINGDHYRETKKKGGTSPNELPLPRQTKGGTSPNEDKQEHSKEQLSKETNKQPVVVSSSDDEEKKRILAPYPLRHDIIASFMDLSLEHIRNSVLAYEQYVQIQTEKRKTIFNPLGTLRDAIVCGWKPNLKKQNDEDAKQKEVLESEKLRSKNYELACSLMKQHQSKFNENFSFTIGASALSLRYPKNSFYPLSLMDKDFEQIIMGYIRRNKSK